MFKMIASSIPEILCYIFILPKPVIFIQSQVLISVHVLICTHITTNRNRSENNLEYHSSEDVIHIYLVIFEIGSLAGPKFK